MNKSGYYVALHKYQSALWILRVKESESKTAKHKSLLDGQFH